MGAEAGVYYLFAFKALLLVRPSVLNGRAAIFSAKFAYIVTEIGKSHGEGHICDAVVRLDEKLAALGQAVIQKV